MIFLSKGVIFRFHVNFRVLLNKPQVFFKKQIPYRVTCFFAALPGFIAMLNTFGLAGAAGYQAGSFHLKLVNSCRLPVDQIIRIYII